MKPEIPTKEKFERNVHNKMSHGVYMEFMAKMVKNHNGCNTIVEIGVSAGEGGEGMLNGCPHAKYYGYDRWTGLDEQMKKHAYKRLGSKENVTLTQIDSHTLKELPMADLIHVDGDHSVQNAILDMDLAKNFLNPKGIMLVHDVDSHTVQDAVKQWYEKNKDKFDMEILKVEHYWAIIWRK